MVLHGWATLLACAAQMSLGLLAVLRGGANPLAYPLAVLCLALFAWNFAGLAHGLEPAFGWKYVEHAASALAVPASLNLMLVSIGQRRRRRWVLAATVAWIGGVAAVSLLGFVFEWAQAFNRSDAWSLVVLAAAAPSISFGLWLLAREQWTAADVESRQRSRLILVAIGLAFPLALTDLLDDAVLQLPRLSSTGTLFGAVLLAIVALRLRLLGRDLSTSAATYAGSVALLVVLGYAAVFRVLVSHTAALVLATVAVTMVLGGLGYRLVADRAVLRARAHQMHTLGRFGAQMAHDLKNPLAALKGAVQLLREEHARGRSLDARADFLELMGAQIERMEHTLDEYHRMGRMEPSREHLSVNDVVREVAALHRAHARIEVRLELAEGIPPFLGDRHLLARGLDNLVRNALESMPDGGTLTVRTSARGQPVAQVLVAVQDTGAGMDALTLERAFDEFFTTKPEGSGLGLPFARRVVEAHGGEIALNSRVGRGTLVELRLPLGV